MKNKAKAASPSVERFFEHLLLRVDGPAVLILKGHLLIEEMLFDLLARRVFRDAAALSAANLTFAKTLQLCRAWAPQPQVAPTWDLIEALNTLRNDLAHALDTPKRKETLAKIRSLYQKANPDSELSELYNLADDEAFLLAVFAFVGGILLAIARPGEPPPSTEALFNQLVASRRT